MTMTYDRTMTTKTSALSAALTKAIASPPRPKGEFAVVTKTFDAIGDADLVKQLQDALVDGSISPEKAVDVLEDMGVSFVCSPVTLRRWMNKQRRVSGVSA